MLIEHLILLVFLTAVFPLLNELMCTEHVCVPTSFTYFRVAFMGARDKLNLYE